MPKNKMDDLRNHLFAALEALGDEENPMDTDRAEAIAKVAQTIINSRKVEIEAYKAVSKAGENMPAVWNQKMLPEETKNDYEN